MKRKKEPVLSGREWLLAATEDEFEALGLEAIKARLVEVFGPGPAYPFANAAIDAAFARILVAAARVGAAGTTRGVKESA